MSNVKQTRAPASQADTPTEPIQSPPSQGGGPSPPGGAPPPRYKSEVFMTILQDAHSFEERQKSLWEDMHERMERRRKEWDEEVASLRRDFFRLKPDETRRGSSDNLLEKMDLRNMFYDARASHCGGRAGKEGEGGCAGKVFRVSFDVSQFLPEEISVRTEDQHLIVHARHDQKGLDEKVTREFSRQVDIPPNIDPLSLRSTLSSDGILQVEAEVSAPAYDRIRETADRLQHAGVSATPSLSSTSIGGGCRTSTTSSSSSFSSVFDGGRGSGGVEQDGGMFRLAVEIGCEFQPEDLTVKTVDRKLVVHARHEEKTPGRTSSRQFSREFDLPDTVDPNQVTASLTGQGQLVLEAPLLPRSLQDSHGGRGPEKRGVAAPGFSTQDPSINVSFAQRRL